MTPKNRALGAEHPWLDLVRCFLGLVENPHTIRAYEDGSAQIVINLRFRKDMPGTPVPRAYAER